MSQQLVFTSLKKIASNGVDANDEIIKVVNKTIQDNDIVLFKELVDKENLTFPPEIYCEIVKHKALKIFFYLFVEARTKQEEKNINECYKNIQNPQDAGTCGKRSANPKPMTKTFNVNEYCNVPQSVFTIASQHEDKRILQFIIACGVPIDIETYNLSRRSTSGWCSSLAMAMNHQCKPNDKKSKAILYAI